MEAKPLGFGPLGGGGGGGVGQAFRVSTSTLLSVLHGCDFS